jgi:F-type H+-transporting ATPase subunit delta
MARIASGKRYAQAAFELAREKNELESWQVDLRKIAELSTDESLMDLLENPRLPFQLKRELLETRLGDINALALNLACLLVGKGILGIAGDISLGYDRLLDAHRGIEHAEVLTALSLDEGDKQRLSSKLGELVNREVIVDARVDPAIIGGFKARVDDMLIDASVRNRLESLRKSLIGVGR